MSQGFAIVIDIGKTVSKVSLWSREGLLLDRMTRPNEPVEVAGMQRLDAEGIGQFILKSLEKLSSQGVQYIIPVAHGAGAAALVNDQLAFLPLDYEQDLPQDLLAQYRRERGAFAETGSPALPGGLNLGAQLFWLDQIHPAEMAEATLLPWAQYWAWFLCGKAVSEVTSLACHTDLWAPQAGDYSALARKRGWADRFAPMAQAGDVIGTLHPAKADSTGLSPGTKILTGLHDSNAALMAARGFAQIEDQEATVLSTGTWFIAMRLAKEGLSNSAMPEARDCLVNVDAFGSPVPSARFMGGREIETLIEVDTRQVDIKPDQPHLLAAVADVLAHGSMVLPTLAPGNGPFPGSEGCWINCPVNLNARRAAACLYAALVTDTMLDLVGSRNVLLIEGRFAQAQVFVRALASLRPDMQVYTANAHNDVSFGALRLIDPELSPKAQLCRVEPLAEDLTAYRASWHERIEART